MKERISTNQEPLEDSRNGDVAGGPYGREKSLGGFRLWRAGKWEKRKKTAARQ